MASAQYLYMQQGRPIAQRRNGAAKVYQYDGMGSVRQMIDKNGTVTDTFRFDMFGEVVSRTGTTKTPFSWNVGAGMQTGPSGFYVENTVKGMMPWIPWGNIFDSIIGRGLGGPLGFPRAEYRDGAVWIEVTWGGWVKIVPPSGIIGIRIGPSGIIGPPEPPSPELPPPVVPPTVVPPPTVDPPPAQEIGPPRPAPRPCYDKVTFLNILPTSFRYGCFCGDALRQPPGNLVTPRDCVDYCCLIHDRCLEAHYGAGLSGFCAHHCCDAAMKECAWDKLTSGCCNSSPNPSECRKAALLIWMSFGALSDVIFGDPDKAGLYLDPYRANIPRVNLGKCCNCLPDNPSVWRQYWENFDYGS